MGSNNKNEKHLNKERQGLNEITLLEQMFLLLFI
jgi:hypothetical protein